MGRLIPRDICSAELELQRLSIQLRRHLPKTRGLRHHDAPDRGSRQRPAHDPHVPAGCIPNLRKKRQRRRPECPAPILPRCGIPTIAWPAHALLRSTFRSNFSRKGASMIAISNRYGAFQIANKTSCRIAVRTLGHLLRGPCPRLRSRLTVGRRVLLVGKRFKQNVVLPKH